VCRSVQWVVENTKQVLFSSLLNVDPASIFQAAQHKLHHNISKAENTRLSRDLIEMMQLPVLEPAPSEQQTSHGYRRLRTLRRTSGWLHANPAFFPNHINYSAFQIAFSCGHLHLVDITKPCPGCGRRVLDRFGQHLFHCDKRFSAPLRNRFHAFL
jgi:hypothetical protein